ncbi:MAG: hypothetical protein WCC53_05120 [Thermoanaerobaculia bacterium]
MTVTPAAQVWLEALGLEPRLPDARFFEDLFLRFQRRVACETLTRPAGDPSSFDPETFAAEWVEEERGLAGEERALAFAWLAGQLGLEVRIGEGLCSRPWEWAERGEERPDVAKGGFSSQVNGAEAHRSVIATMSGRRILADAGFPLPVLLPLDPPAREIPTGFGTLTVERRDGHEDVRVKHDARGEVSELLRLGPAPAAPALSLEENRRPAPDASPEPGAGGSKSPFALRILDDRLLYWAGGVMTILDAWSRFSYPLAGTERAALESLFALDLGGIELPGVRAPEFPPALTVFHSVPLGAEEARRGLDLGAPPPSPLICARTAHVADAPGGSRISLTATLAERVPAAGPGESVRKTLVFGLAMKLLELGRGA